MNDTPAVDGAAKSYSAGGNRRLQSGRDYPVWPAVKWMHARRLADELQAAIVMYRTSLGGTETTVEYSADRRRATFFARLPISPPAYEWSLLFGDIIHNYRASLDGLTWAMAHLDAAVPDSKRAKRIQFPFADSREEFAKLARGDLRDLPAFVLDRLQAVQPYHGNGVDQPVGQLLHALDIEDKHHSALDVELYAMDHTTFTLMSRWVDPLTAPAPDEEGGLTWKAGDGPVRDGDRIVEWDFGAPVAEASIDSLPLVPLVRFEGERRPVLPLLDLIERQVYATFVTVEEGRIPEHMLAWVQGDDGHPR